MNLKVGQKASREMSVTAEKVAKYAEITGDYNPLHFDEEFVSRTRFKKPICQGGITTGLLHALVAMDMPGAGTVFTTQNWSFPRPVYIGDSMKATATVMSTHPRHPQADIAFTVTNQDGKEVLTGQATVYQADPERSRG